MIALLCSEPGRNGFRTKADAGANSKGWDSNFLGPSSGSSWDSLRQIRAVRGPGFNRPWVFGASVLAGSFACLRRPGNTNSLISHGWIEESSG